MDAPFISEATAESVKGAFRRGFETFKLLGATANLQLWRDSAEDGTAEAVPAQEVLVILAKREASAERGQGAGFMSADGELQKLWPFDVQRNDRFTLPDGASGRITTAPLRDGDIVRAPFTLEV